MVSKQSSGLNTALQAMLRLAATAACDFPAVSCAVIPFFTRSSAVDDVLEMTELISLFRGAIGSQCSQETFAISTAMSKQS